MSIEAAADSSIGWIGTGVMGAPMCGHLLAAGYDVSVFNRSRESLDALVAEGAIARSSPADVAVNADVVFTMLGFPSDVREVVLGDDGVLAGARPGTLLVDMTTSEPSLAREIYEVAASKDIDALDAPVSGGDVGARAASLVIMVGGSEQVLARARPLLEKLGRTIVYFGGAGAGQHAKMVNQVAIASGMIGVCEALLYAYRAGLDVERVLETIGGGAAGSWSLANYGPRAVKGDFEPGFKIDHFVKDLGIAIAEARRLGLALPGLALAEQLYLAAQAQGLGQKGTHSLLLSLAELSEIEWSPAAPAAWSA